MPKTPIFKGDEIPPLLLLNDDVLTEKEEALLQKMAHKLRKAYDLYLEHRHKGSPYGQALDVVSLIKDRCREIF